MKPRVHGVWFYVGYILLWTFAVIAIAALAGAIIFPLFGKLGGSTQGIGELALFGARQLAEWAAKVWALAIALVLAFHRAYRERQTRDDQTGRSPPPG